LRLTLRNLGDGRTCIGDGYHCCSTFFCVDYDPGAVFADSEASYLHYVSNLDTSTIVNYQTSTTYETVTIASGTVTVTPTSTQEVTVTNIQTVSVTVTTQVGTCMVTVLTTVMVSPSPTPTTGSGGSTTVPGPIVTTVPFVSTTESIPHSSISSWPGSGNLLVGYCTTPDYVLLTGPTPYWAPFIGCDQNKPDCCPFAVVTAAANYPVPQSTSQATLPHCPDDYQTVSDGCCPS
jgi:hypothetical protein